MDTGFGNRDIDAPATPKWKPINAKQRRVIGVLVEKAKTTPNNYPLSLNAVTTGANQKSNRFPHMDLDAEEVEDTLNELREMQVVGEIQGDGRVPKFRHYMKEWLAVDGTELAVMAELLLRGAQTIGELRGRAARMAGNHLPDMAALKPVLNSLIEKKLVIAITPEGRGQIVTHGLYLPNELERVLRENSGGGTAAAGEPQQGTTTPAAPVVASAPARSAAAAPAASNAGDVEALRAEVDELRQELTRLKQEVDDIWSNLKVSED